MWKPIEIKPGDQSFVGKHIRLHECGTDFGEKARQCLKEVGYT